jgi:hypothetical protein
MPEISFICVIYHLGEDNYQEKYFGKILLDYLSDKQGPDPYYENDLDILVKYNLKKCLKQFNKKFRTQLKLEKVGILGLIKNYFTSENDKEIFDVYIDNINKKFYYFANEIDTNIECSDDESDVDD